ncbi:MAG TPA: T9SS type A sorting domain-containing protein [Chitinophagales bacterium]|nr:T9SS type A sorting domain-containing protein [Chitinophagales bacterium]HRP38218.1 T9SS type A sorting domain-containing protein [Chitinophagales bacterium]
MKFFIATIFLAAFFTQTFSQQYPFKESFEGTLNGQLPAGWVGDISVQGYHGVGDGKGLAASLSSTDMMDSVITPLIGPVNSSTSLLFFYRWVAEFIYPSDPRMPNSKDKLEIFASTDSTNFSLVYTIDSSNHQPSLLFKKVEVPLGSFAGNSVWLKFKCTWGGGKYFQDIDSVKVQTMATAINEVETAESNIELFPNPASKNMVVKFSNCASKDISVYSLSGKQVLQQKLSCDESIDVSTLENGMYFLQVEGNAKKFVVLR